MKQLSLILIGGGDRGSSYLKSLQITPECFKLVGLAEPVKEKREYLQKLYNVPAEHCFESYEELLALPKIADIAMICTQDKMHFAPAMKAIEKKYVSNLPISGCSAYNINSVILCAASKKYSAYSKSVSDNSFGALTFTSYFVFFTKASIFFPLSGLIIDVKM